MWALLNQGQSVSGQSELQLCCCAGTFPAVSGMLANDPPRSLSSRLPGCMCWALWGMDPCRRSTCFPGRREGCSKAKRGCWGAHSVWHGPLEWHTAGHVWQGDWQVLDSLVTSRTVCWANGPAQGECPPTSSRQGSSTCLPVSRLLCCRTGGCGMPMMGQTASSTCADLLGSASLALTGWDASGFCDSCASALRGVASRAMAGAASVPQHHHQLCYLTLFKMHLNTIMLYVNIYSILISHQSRTCQALISWKT